MKESRDETIKSLKVKKELERQIEEDVKKEIKNKIVKIDNCILECFIFIFFLNDCLSINYFIILVLNTLKMLKN